jgi:hypothetical protein
MVTVTRSAGGLERAITRKKYADQYDHTHLLRAGRGLERHAVVALIQQLQERLSGGAQGYDLSLDRNKELIHEEVEQRPPLEIPAELRAIEQEILQGIEELGGMLR